MLQKIIKVGNSYAITIPKNFVDETKLKLGDSVQVQQNLAQEILTIRKAVSSPLSNEEDMVTPEFYQWMKKFTKRYHTALTELANK